MSKAMICNTVQFRFPVGAVPPSWEEIAEFIKKLNLDQTQLETVYKMPRDKSVCIKLKSSDAFEDVLQRNEERLKFAYFSGAIVEVCMSIAGRIISYVRVFDLPPELPDNTISLALGEFGKVENVVREKFPVGLGLDHVQTGVRGVYIDIGKDIPASLELNNWRARIFYDGLKNRCFACNMEGHRKDSCPQRKVWKKKEKRNEELSYAGVVESGVVSLLDETGSVENDIIEEELIEEEDTQETVAEQQRTEEAEEAEQRYRMQEQGLVKMMTSIKEAVTKHQASERRAQFAASGSTEMLRPKKAARKSSK